MMEGTRVRYTGGVQTLGGSGLTVGDLGTVTRGAEYVPGLDAGQWTVQPDAYPEASPYGHRSVSYWTAEQMLTDWEVVNE